MQTPTAPPNAPQERQVLVYQVPIPEPLRWLEPRETETRTTHALGDYGVINVKFYEDIAPPAHRNHLRLSGPRRRPLPHGPSPIPKFDNPKMDIVRRCSSSAPGAKSASTRSRPIPGEEARLRGSSVRAHRSMMTARSAARPNFLDEVMIDDDAGRMFVCSDSDYCESGRLPITRKQPSERALLTANGLSKAYGPIQACRDIPLRDRGGRRRWRSSASSGSGKTTLLHLIAGLMALDAGEVRYRLRDGAVRELTSLSEGERRSLMRTDCGFVHQDAARGLRMSVLPAATSVSA